MSTDIRKQLDKLLKRVEKPGRYIGGEVNSVLKDTDKADVNFCFCFPDIYEIGMSYLGLQIIYKVLNDIPNVYCQRAFQPQTDMEELMREEGIPLFSLESKTPLREMDMVGFTLQYEMSFTTVLNMIDLAGIPMFARDREEDMPLIVCGGPCAYNPEPLWEFADAFLIGDGEELLPKFMDLYADMKKRGATKEEFLKEAVKLQGVYVPAFYEVKYNEDRTISELCKLYEGASYKVKRAILPSVQDSAFPVDPIIPMVEAVHDRAVVETFRGCTRGCRFCQAGMIYRPVRERTRDRVIDLAVQQLKNTGHEELSLLSLSSSDHTQFEDMALDLVDITKAHQVSLSLPSLRMDKFAFNVLQRIQEYKKSGLTYAPEAGTQRLRDVINKGVTENDIYTSVRQALELGWTHIKLYFMIGLPTETYEDLDGIVEIANNIKNMNFEINGKKSGRFKLTVSVSNFVPKADTPFQWEPQDTAEEFRKKHVYLAERLRSKHIVFNYHDNETSSYEAVFARGDRRTSKLLYKAWELGCKLDGWSEHYRPDLWDRAFEESGVDRDFYTTRKRSFEEILPWDIIDCCVSKEFFKREALKAYGEEITPDCRYGCAGCGINRDVKCEKGGIYNAQIRN